MNSQNIPFQWPLDQLSLYSGIYDYLKHSGVSTAISMEIEHFYDGYPKLLEEWTKVESRRHEIVAEVEKCQCQHGS